MINLDDIRAAQDAVSRVALRTPILPLKFAPRPDVYCKCENLQRTGAFKIRGAYNRISNLATGAKGVIAHSSGNHAQAVGLAANLLGLPAAIVMLDGAVLQKVEATRSHGAEVIFGGPTSADIARRAEEEAERRGWSLVHPFADPEIMAGQGTVGLEIIQDMADLQAVVVPIGGGGLISGVSTAVKQSLPGVKVFGVEPEGAAAMTAALREGHTVDLPEVDTIADGLKPLAVSEATLTHVQHHVDEVVRVSDEEILQAMRHYLQKEKLVVEPSGAATLAAVCSGRLDLPDGPVVCVISGGNADLSLVV